jgi:hypothetical protein
MDTWLMSDEYAEWFTAFCDEWRRQKFHCLTGNMPGGPGISVIRACFQAGMTPTETLMHFKQEDTAFFLKNRLNCD